MNVFQVQERTLFAPSVCDFILELRCKSVECYGRLCVKTRVSLLSYYTETMRTTYDSHVPAPGTRCVQQDAVCRRCPDRTAVLEE